MSGSFGRRQYYRVVVVCPAPAAFVNAAAATDTDEVMGIYLFIDQSILSC